MALLTFLNSNHVSCWWTYVPFSITSLQSSTVFDVLPLGSTFSFLNTMMMTMLRPIMCDSGQRSYHWLESRGGWWSAVLSDCTCLVLRVVFDWTILFRSSNSGLALWVLPMDSWVWVRCDIPYRVLQTIWVSASWMTLSPPRPPDFSSSLCHTLGICGEHRPCYLLGHVLPGESPWGPGGRPPGNPRHPEPQWDRVQHRQRGDAQQTTAGQASLSGYISFLLNFYSSQSQLH